MFVSDAQNFEDVILWRVLKNVRDGFYVDVGAESSEIGTVTRAFYLAGWHGINIEPVPYWYDQLVRLRPRDINIRCVCGPDPGMRVLYEVIGTGLSTADLATAERHKRELGYDFRRIEVECRRLDSIIDRHAVGDIHFLKIDVEGAERDVLESIDLKRIRPWIILLEATEPNSQKPTHHLWESLLLTQDYPFSYFDGLNRWYIAREKYDELHPVLSVPPNVFDNFRRR